MVQLVRKLAQAGPRKAPGLSWVSQLGSAELPRDRPETWITVLRTELLHPWRWPASSSRGRSGFKYLLIH